MREQTKDFCLFHSVPGIMSLSLPTTTPSNVIQTAQKSRTRIPLQRANTCTDRQTDTHTHTHTRGSGFVPVIDPRSRPPGRRFGRRTGNRGEDVAATADAAVVVVVVADRR